MLHNKLNHLLDIGAAVRAREKVGAAYRDVIKIEGKNYLYNPTNITRVLGRKINSVYDALPTPSSILDDIWQLDIEDGPRSMTRRQRIERRKNVKMLQKFVRRHADDFKKSSKFVEIQVWVKLYNKNKKKEEESTIWLPGEMVDGGKYKLMKYIKSKTRDLKQQIEDSPKTVLDMKLVELLMNDIPESITLFEHIKLFGGGLNYMHYNLEAGEYTGTCVPVYIVVTLNNENEKDRNRRMKKLTNETVLIELGMKSLTEGCSLEQIISFCNRRNVTYYALNYKYATFKTNAGDKTRKRTNLPPLYFMVGCQHLYPITDELQQRSIRSINAKTGGLCKVIKNCDREQKKTKSIITEEAHIIEYWVNKYTSGELCHDDVEYRIICTKPNLVSNYFYDLLQRQIVYGKKVTVHGNRVTRFLIHERFIIEENEDYNDVICTIDTLNESISIEKNKYIYTGQPLHILAYEYYMNTYDNHIQSSMSPQVFEIFESKLSRNSAFNEFYDKHIDVAIDKNKFYAHILTVCDQFGWSIFTVLDEVQHFDGTIATGIFYVETTCGFPLRGNGWYFDGVVNDALDLSLIQPSDIKYQVKASLKLDRRHFHSFVQDIFKMFYSQKQAIVAFIGYLAKNYMTCDKSYFSNDINEVANDFSAVMVM